jgi:hypothetical protein
MSLAYHDRRMPPELQRADYHVSSNLGRTIHAGRQSIIDARACVDWLAAQGYRRIGILGTSLGSCIAFIAAAHDRRISTGVFNHVSMYFSDVVWTGLSTEHIRKGFADHVTQDQLREYWAPMGAARLHFPAGLLVTGARVLPAAPAPARSFHPPVRPLHHRPVSLQHFRRHGNVPLPFAQPVGVSAGRHLFEGVCKKGLTK